MPQHLGIPFVWRTARSLRVGDELLLNDGGQVFVSEVYDDGANGTWIELDDGNCGYTSGRWRVIT